MKTLIKRWFLLPALMAGFVLIPAGRVTAQAFTNLYSFKAAGYDALIEADTNSEGAFPGAGLVLSGKTLYGTVTEGGTNGNGTVFAVNTDGTGFTVLHTFTATVTNSSRVFTNSDGASPQAELILSGNTLYGTASAGGANGNGTVFAINTNGTGFTNLHSFTALSAAFSGTNSDGASPKAGLVLSGSTLYGTAYGGGTNGNGTVFACFINGANSTFSVLHSFTAYPSGKFTNSDGANPQGTLVLSGSTLYGTAADGGAGENGAVFAVNTNGTGFTNLYSFTALSPVDFNNNDGANPFAGLVLSGNTLYGTTHSAGTSDGGTVFAVTTNGIGLRVLHSFTGNSDGDNPYAGLISSGNTLFGTAGNGGNAFDGTLFAVTANGTNPVFSVLHTFTNSPDGGSPHAVMILSGNTLYGTAESGGTNGSGMAFSLSLPTPPLTIVLSGTNNIVTWPTNALVFTLQSTTNLLPPVVWTTVSSPPYAVINTNNVVTNTISGTPQFYRLSL